MAIEPVGPVSRSTARLPSIKIIGIAAAVALAAVIALDAVAVVADIAEYRLLTRAIDGELISEAEFERNDNRQSDIGILQLGMLVIAAALYLTWMFRARKNLDKLGVEGLSFDARWGIFVWFVPIWNLFRPYQITSEIARASDPRYPRDGEWWKAAPVPAVLGFWWGAWLISGAVGRLLLRSAFRDPETFEEFRNRSVVFIISDGADILAAALAIAVVYAVTAAQDRKALARAAGIDLRWDRESIAPT